ncbi:MAG: flagellar hook-associated protein FlgK, partial [Phycisphaerae bacterium]|nr:flagellar hook-associated protein FlgK [Phycisphaerae bacterium]
MNLPSAFQIGRSALIAGQHSMTVAGNNMANAATPGYRRQRLGMVGISGPPYHGVGQIGNGVRTTGLTRAIDMALLARLRHSRADEAMLDASQRVLVGVEGSLASAGEKGLAGAVEDFLSQWSALAVSPSDPAMRGVIVEHGVGLAAQVRQLRARLLEQRSEVDRSLQDGVNRVNQLLAEIESLSDDIRAAESAGGSNPTLRDQRDRLVDELATLMGVTVVDRSDGTLDLLVGSTPIMLQGASMGVSLSITNSGAAFAVTLDGAPLAPGGSLGALVLRRADGVEQMISRLDAFALQLIDAVNRVHVEGQGLHGRTTLTSFLGVNDPTIPLSQNGLHAPVTAGTISFKVW